MSLYGFGARLEVQVRTLHLPTRARRGTTNNHAERALRPSVKQRRNSGCHGTTGGAENRDSMMSVLVGTTRPRGKDLLTD